MSISAPYSVQSAVASPTASFGSGQTVEAASIRSETLLPADSFPTDSNVPWFGRYWLDWVVAVLNKQDKLLLNLLPVGVGFIQAWIYIRQTNILQIQTKIQEAQGEFNRLQTVLTQRARLSFQSPDVEPVSENGSHSLSEWVVALKWRNHGLTPAQDVHVKVCLSRELDSLERDLNNSDPKPRIPIPPQGEIVAARFKIKPSDFIRNDDFIYYGVRISYSNIFKSTAHIEQLCFQITRSSPEKLSFALFNPVSY